MAFPISCGACGASFSIPDEIYQRRVAGRLVTIKCKQCRANIQVDGRQEGPPSARPGEPTNAASSSEATASKSASPERSMEAVGAESASAPKQGERPAPGDRRDDGRAVEGSDEAVPSSGTRSGLGWRPSQPTPESAADEESPAPSRRRILPESEADSEPEFETGLEPPRGSESNETSEARESEPPESGPAAIERPRPEQRSGLSVQRTRSIEPEDEPDPWADQQGRSSAKEPSDPAAEDLWAVSYAENDDRELTESDIAKQLALGSIDANTLVWHEGMSNWEPLARVPSLARHVPGPKHRVTPAPAQKPADRPQMADQTPTPAPFETKFEPAAPAFVPAAVSSGGLLGRTMLGVGPSSSVAEEQEKTPQVTFNTPTQGLAGPVAPMPMAASVAAQPPSPVPAPMPGPVAPRVVGQTPFAPPAFGAVPPLAAPAGVPAPFAVPAPTAPVPAPFAPPIGAAMLAPPNLSAPSPAMPSSPAAGQRAGMDPFSPWAPSSPPAAAARPLDLDLEIMPPMRKRTPVLWIGVGAVIVIVGALFALASASGGSSPEGPVLVPSSGPSAAGPSAAISASRGEQDPPAEATQRASRSVDLLAPPSTASGAEAPTKPKKPGKRGFTETFAKQLDGRKGSN